MEAAEIKLELFRYIDSLGENKLLQFYQHLIQNTHKNETDFWITLNEWQRNDIEAGLTDLKHGRKQSFDKAISKYEQ
ncbi:MAG: hypothetical protein GXO89_03980 [Chlorobi bacterium]|nr:hypothetical protein [Chlorobiota bacterium]